MWGSASTMGGGSGGVGGGCGMVAMWMRCGRDVDAMWTRCGWGEGLIGLGGGMVGAEGWGGARVGWGWVCMQSYGEPPGIDPTVYKIECSADAISAKSASTCSSPC